MFLTDVRDWQDTLTVPSDCFCSTPWICAARSSTISHTCCWTLQQRTNDVGPDRQVKCSSSQPAWIRQSGQVDQGLSHLTRNCKTYVWLYLDMFPEIFNFILCVCVCVFFTAEKHTAGWRRRQCFITNWQGRERLQMRNTTCVVYTEVNMLFL